MESGASSRVTLFLDFQPFFQRVDDLGVLDAVDERALLFLVGVLNQAGAFHARDDDRVILPLRHKQFLCVFQFLLGVGGIGVEGKGSESE